MYASFPFHEKYRHISPESIKKIMSFESSSVRICAFLGKNSKVQSAIQTLNLALPTFNSTIQNFNSVILSNSIQLCR